MTAPPDTATTSDARWLLHELSVAKIVAPAACDAILDDFLRAGTGGDAPALADFLVQGGLVSAFQVETAMAGKAASLLLGPYLLVEPVGSGSLGTVYRAVHTDTRQRFAVKLLPLRSLWNVIQAKRQVAAFAAMPAQAALVPFVDIDTAGGSHYLVWPFVEGETFESLVRRTGPLAPAHAVRFVAEALQGLAACHAAGIAHGLIKPSNLLLGPDHKARVLDLGIGAILSENIADGESLMDTISTANVAMSMIDCTPPETLANPAARTPAADLYSVGCVLYYLLTGGYPFPDGNAVDKMIAHQTLDALPVAARNPRVPEGLSHLVEHLLRKSPEDRPTDLNLLVSALYETVPEAATLSPADLPTPRTGGAPSVGPTEGLGQHASDVPDFGATGLSHGGRSSASAGRSPFLVEDAETVNFDLHDPPETPRESGVIKAGAVARTAPPAPPPAPIPEGLTEVVLPSEPIRQIVLQGRAPAAPPTPVAPAPPGRGGPASLPAVGLPPTPINWAATPDGPTVRELGPVRVPPVPTLTRTFWDRVRALLTWQPPQDVVQFSLFGPAKLVPGQTYQFHVYAHPPDSFASVCTISRAFTSDADLLATGYAGKLVPRGSPVGLHLSVVNAAVARSLVNFPWVGQSKPSKFDVHVPWESPAGVINGVLSVGLNQVQVSRVPFEVVVLPRTA